MLRILSCESYQDYEDPVNDTYEETGKMYNRVVDFMMDNIAENLSENRINMVVATHNEAGALHAANKMLRWFQGSKFLASLLLLPFQFWHPPGFWTCRVWSDLWNG